MKKTVVRTLSWIQLVWLSYGRQIACEAEESQVLNKYSWVWIKFRLAVKMFCASCKEQQCRLAVKMFWASCKEQQCGLYAIYSLNFVLNLTLWLLAQRWWTSGKYFWHTVTSSLNFPGKVLLAWRYFSWLEGISDIQKYFLLWRKLLMGSSLWHLSSRALFTLRSCFFPDTFPLLHQTPMLSHRFFT